MGALDLALYYSADMHMEPDQKIIAGEIPENSRGAGIPRNDVAGSWGAPQKLNGRTVCIQGLKSHSARRLPLSSQLRAVITMEKDHLTVTDFLAKMDTWLKLLNLEAAERPVGPAASLDSAG